MGIDHILHRVGDKVARRERIQHAVVAHSYSVVDGYGIEFGGKAAEAFYLFLYNLSGIMQVGMTRNKLGKRVYNGYHRTAHLFLRHAVRSPESPGAGHSSAFCRGVAAKWMCHYILSFIICMNKPKAPTA